MWYAYAIASIFFTITYSLISKKLLTKNESTNPITYAAMLFFSVSLVSFVAYFISGVQTVDLAILSNSNFLFLIIANVALYSIAPSFYYRALKDTPLSEVTILYSLTGLYSLIIATVIGTEAFAISRFFGGLLILISILLVQFKKGKWTWSKYTIMLVFATFLYALASITDNLIIANNYLPLLLFQAINFGVPSILILLINPASIYPLPELIKNKKFMALIGLNSVFFFFSFFNIYKAYEVGGVASQVNMLISTETIFMVIFAALFLKEKNNLFIKIIAAILTSIGVYLIR